MTDDLHQSDDAKAYEMMKLRLTKFVQALFVRFSGIARLSHQLMSLLRVHYYVSTTWKIKSTFATIADNTSLSTPYPFFVLSPARGSALT